MPLSARENLTLPDLSAFWRSGLLRRRQETAETKRWFDRFDVRPAGAYEAALATFSGGNQQKLMFGKWLRRNPAVLLLDEPTQGVDIGAKTEIHRQLVGVALEGMALVIASSDVDEIAAICHRVLVLHRGHLVADLAGAEVTVSAISHAALGYS